MSVSLETQLDLAHRVLARCEQRALTVATDRDKLQSAQADVDTAKAIVNTLELHIGCRDAGEDWMRRIGQPI